MCWPRSARFCANRTKFCVISFRRVTLKRGRKYKIHSGSLLWFIFTWYNYGNYLELKKKIRMTWSTYFSRARPRYLLHISNSFVLAAIPSSNHRACNSPLLVPFEFEANISFTGLLSGILKTCPPIMHFQV